jgi:hypothetical protein
MSQIGNISFDKTKSNKPYMKSKNTPYSSSLYFEEIHNEKTFDNFIKRTEQLIRTSKEYLFYIKKLKTDIDALTHDNIQYNITSKQTQIEFHHYPFNLYSIVQIVAIHNYLNDIKFTSFSLVKEVMRLHSNNYIGLVPLSKSNHQLAHSNAFNISLNQVFGNIDEFIKLYEDSIPEENKLIIKSLKESQIDDNILVDKNKIIKSI